MNRQKSFAARRAAFTLVELLLGLTVISILSTAVCFLLTGAFNTNRYLVSANDTTSQMDLAITRLLHNIRACTALTDPTALTTQHTFTIHTQPDPYNSFQSYTVVYTLVGTQLIETDDRYGSNVICNNVSVFNVTKLSATSPISLQITLTAGAANSLQITRTFRALCRNL